MILYFANLPSFWKVYYCLNGLIYTTVLNVNFMLIGYVKILGSVLIVSQESNY